MSISREPVIKSGPLDLASIGWRQLVILGIALLLAALDGFDALSMSFVAPVVGHNWHLTKDVLGLLLASSLVGMAVGALGVSPLADLVGRRPIVLSAVATLTAGAVLSGISTSGPILGFARFVTGVGIGTMVAMTALIAAEFSNFRLRSLAIALTTSVGFPLGGVIGGFAAGLILRNATWPWIFFAAAFAGAVLFIICAVFLPETPSFLISRQAPGAIGRVNRLLTKLGHPTMMELPMPVERRQSTYRQLFRPEKRATTLSLTTVMILNATAAYFLLNWLPAIVTQAGFSPATGSFVSATAGLLGIVGGLTFGALAIRFRLIPLAAVAIVGIGGFMAAVGVVPGRLSLLLVSAAGFHFCLAGVGGILWAIVAGSYPPSNRASGLGLVMGVGRIASAIGPALGGVLFAHGFSRPEVCLAFAVLPTLAAFILTRLPNPVRSGPSATA